MTTLDNDLNECYTCIRAQELLYECHEIVLCDSDDEADSLMKRIIDEAENLPPCTCSYGDVKQDEIPF